MCFQIVLNSIKKYEVIVGTQRPTGAPFGCRERVPEGGNALKCLKRSDLYLPSKGRRFGAGAPFDETIESNTEESLALPSTARSRVRLKSEHCV